MYALMLGVAAAAVGIDVGWQRMPEGGMEYIIQLDPQTLELLRAGETIQSYIPPAAGEVRSYRIVAGANKLPRQAPPAPKSPEPKSSDRPQKPRPAAPQTLSPDPGGKPIVGRPAVFLEPQGTTAAKTVLDRPAAAPWLPLTFALLGLFASLGTNVYLGWIAWDSRRQLALRPAAPTV